MKLVIALLAVCALLAGCQLPSGTGNALGKACNVLNTTYPAYTIAAAGGLVPASLSGQVAAVYPPVKAICDNPPADVQQALVQVTTATVVIAKALRAAKD